jgi:hypothetical protein
MNNDCCEKKINGQDTNLQEDLQLGNFASDPERLLVPDGSVSRPSIGFISSPDTGLYSATIDTLRVVANGIPVVTCSSAAMVPLLQMRVSNDGSLNATKPHYSFNTDTNSGLYAITADNIGISCGGVKQVDVSTTNAVFTNAVRSPRFFSTENTFSGSWAIGASLTLSSADLGVNNITGYFLVAVGNTTTGATHSLYVVRLWNPDFTNVFQLINSSMPQSISGASLVITNNTGGTLTGITVSCCMIGKTG